MPFGLGVHLALQMATNLVSRLEALAPVLSRSMLQGSIPAPLPPGVSQNSNAQLVMHMHARPCQIPPARPPSCSPPPSALPPCPLGKRSTQTHRHQPPRKVACKSPLRKVACKPPPTRASCESPPHKVACNPPARKTACKPPLMPAPCKPPPRKVACKPPAMAASCKSPHARTGLSLKYLPLCQCFLSALQARQSSPACRSYHSCPSLSSPYHHHL
mmetsp:Transcript_7776/g.18984  ORF Transcript_7776/g.18984 Transcript_7776/m.18984 type:complete len:216 (+) Transcript_7776:119-766(+)